MRPESPNVSLCFCRERAATSGLATIAKNNAITSPRFAASFRLRVKRSAIAIKAIASGNITALAQYEAPRTVPRTTATFTLGLSRNRNSKPAIA
jgi:hypothetical protein